MSFENFEFLYNKKTIELIFCKKFQNLLPNDKLNSTIASL